MRNRRWIKIGAVAILAFAAFLFFTHDEYYYLRQFDPTDRIVHGPAIALGGKLRSEADEVPTQMWEVFEFRSDPALVASALNIDSDERHTDLTKTYFALPNGDTGFYAEDHAAVGTGRMTCALIVDKTRPLPWWDRTWRMLRHRFGYREPRPDVPSPEQ